MCAMNKVIFGQTSADEIEQTACIWEREFAPRLDFCFAWMRQPLGWVVAVAFFSLLVGLLVGHQGWVVFSICASTAGLGCVWPWVQARSIAGKLEWPKRVSEDSEIAIVLHVTNYLPVPVFGFRLIGLEKLLGQPGLSYIPAWGTTEFRWTTKASFRGHYPQDAMSLSSGFPFGLLECSRGIPAPAQLMVLPKVVEAALNRQPSRGVPDCHGNDSLTSLSGELSQLREYRPGDSLKLCHWPQTVRTGKLIVRDNEDRTTGRYHILIPVEDLAGRPLIEQETVFRSALGILKYLNQSDISVCLTLGNESWCVPGNRKAYQTFLSQICNWQFHPGHLPRERTSPAESVITPRIITSPAQASSCRSQSRARAFQPYLPATWLEQHPSQPVPWVHISISRPGVYRSAVRNQSGLPKERRGA